VDVGVHHEHRVSLWLGNGIGLVLGNGIDDLHRCFIRRQRREATGREQETGNDGAGNEDQ
jgi:hypothetical protein